jgi:hypothetical protein
MPAYMEMERGQNQIQIGSEMSKLKRCAHIYVGKDANGKPEYIRCEVMTSGKGATQEGTPVALCPSHLPLYPPRPRPRKDRNS